MKTSNYSALLRAPRFLWGNVIPEHVMDCHGHALRYLAMTGMKVKSLFEFVLL